MKLPVNVVLLPFIFWAAVSTLMVSGSLSLGSFSPIVLLGFLLYVPGFLTLFALRHRFQSGWFYILHSLGLSIGWMYILGLISSYLGPSVNLERPLDLQPFFGLVIGTSGFLAVCGLIRNWNEYFLFSKVSKKILQVGGYLSAIVVSLVAIVGAVTLNNGGTFEITIGLLISLVIVFSVSLFFPRKLSKFLQPVILFTLALSVLWMLAARSNHITGWDIIQEYLGAKHTQELGRWDTNLKDAYNACLSITILPTVLSNIAGVPLETILKLIFPFLFAHFAVAVYFILKRIANSLLAYLSVFYILAQPFFIQPLIALARQEVAFVFFALLMLTLFSNRMHKLSSKFLLIFYAFGVVVSHYSTTYITIFLIVTAFITYLILKLIKYLPLPEYVENLQCYANWITNYVSQIKWWLVIVLLVFSYTWHILITQSAENISSTLTDTMSNMTQLLRGELKSEEVQQALPTNKTATVTTVEDIKAFEDARTVEKNPWIDVDPLFISRQYPVYPLYEEVVIPNIDQQSSGAIRTFLNFLKEALKIMMILGTIIIAIRSLFKAPRSSDFVVLATVSTCLLTLMLVHPTIGLHYNISRIYLQLLTFLSLSVVVGVFTLMWKLPRLLKVGIIGGIFSFLFLSLHGVLTPLIGGLPFMQLYNKGTDYEKFYVFDGEEVSAKWLKENRDFTVSIFADDLSNLRVYKQLGFRVNPSVLPSVIANSPNSYVYLSNTNVNQNKAQVTFDGKFMTYTFPKKYLEENKSLIYSNKHSQIYR